MSAQSDAAAAFQSRAIARSDVATARALRLWRAVPVSDLDEGWATQGPKIAAVASTAMVRDAADAARMTSAVARADRVAAGDVLNPFAFAGVDGSGRDVEGLLHGAVTTTKEQIGRGVGLVESFLSGGSYLAAMMKTALADAARSSQMTAATGRDYVRYVRVVNPGACSRCAILAGSDRFSKPFLRHPACKCTTVPVTDGKLPEGVLASPQEHFDSLSKAEQDRIYTKAGADAIRLGADPIKVVNARRGARGVGKTGAPTGSQISRLTRVPIGRNPDGSVVLGYVTGEGGTRRGSFARMQERLGVESRRVGLARYSTTTRARLMPETIVDLTPDPEMRRVLLRDAGYLDHRLDYSTNAWIAERVRLEALDRAAADAFYRSRGIRLS